MSVSSLHMHTVCCLNAFFSFWISIGQSCYNCKSTFMPFCIAERNIESSNYRFWVDVCGRLSTDSQINSYCHPLIDRHPVLGLYFMLPVVKSLCFHRSLVLEGLLGWIFSGNCHAPGSLSSLFLGLRVLGHWQQFVIQLYNFSYHLRSFSPQLCKKTKLNVIHLSAGVPKHYGHSVHNMICILWRLRSRNIQLSRNHKNMLEVSFEMFVTE